MLQKLCVLGTIQLEDCCAILGSLCVAVPFPPQGETEARKTLASVSPWWGRIHLFICQISGFARRNTGVEAL